MRVQDKRGSSDVSKSHLLIQAYNNGLFETVTEWKWGDSTWFIEKAYEHSSNTQDQKRVLKEI